MIMVMIMHAALLLPSAKALDCTNLTYASKQDLQIEIAFTVFPSSQNVQTVLITLPSNGTIYEQEIALGSEFGGLRMQGEEIRTVPFGVSQLNIIYYRPFPKQVAEPLSEFFYGFEQAVPNDGSTKLKSQRCWIRISVAMHPETTYPFSGDAGQALFFDGADDHVHSEVYAFPRVALTVSMWVRTLGRKRAGQTVLSFISPAGRELEIRDLNDVRLLRRANETASTAISVNDGTWHHLAVTWQLDGRVKVYVDGRLVHRTILPRGQPLPSIGSVILGQSASVNHTSARDMFRAESRVSATHAQLATTSREKTLIVNRKEALAQMRTSDASYREREPAFLQGVPRGCACRGGAFDHRRSFHGILDELRIYSAVRSELEIQLDMHTVLSYPSIRSVSNASLWLYYTFDSADRWSQVYHSLLLCIYTYNYTSVCMYAYMYV
jgi:hypothetical protein